MNSAVISPEFFLNPPTLENLLHTSASMLPVKRSNVPAYLKSSSFYKSLNEEDDEEIFVPESNLKKNSKVSDATELVHLLSAARFWGLDDLPEDALHYVMYIADEDVFAQIEEYEDAVQTIACLKNIRFVEGEQKVLRAAEYGRIGFIRYLIKKGNVLRASAGIQAASHNHLDCLEFITNTLVKETGKNPYKIVKLHTLPPTTSYACWKHLHEHGAKIVKDSAIQAAEAGNLPCLQYLEYVHENNAKVTKKAMESAIANGHLACVAFIHEQGKIPVNVDSAVLAAANGHLECLKYLFEHGCPPSLKICAAAAHSDHIACLKYAHEQGCRMNKFTMSRTKSLECVKYMREHNVRWDDELFIYAIEKERLDLLRYFYKQRALFNVPHQYIRAACASTGVSLRFLYEHGVTVDMVTVHREMIPEDKLACLKIAMDFGYKPTAEDCAVAAENEAIECLKYLHSCQCPWDESLCTRAARNAQLVTLQYALQHGCPATADACEAAAGSQGEKALECLQALHEAGCPWDERTCNKAVAIACLDRLKYAHKRGCPWSEETFLKVVQPHFRVQIPASELSIVQYLHENKCPWDARLCTLAAGNDYFDVLKYAHENGCPWNAEACAVAAIVAFQDLSCRDPDEVECLVYLHENGCPWDVSVSLSAAQNGNLEALKYLHEHGCPWDARVTAAAIIATYDSLPCLQYLHKNGCAWGAETCAAAARERKFLCLHFAHENGCPWDSTTCTAAARVGSLECLQYAHEQGCAWDHGTYQAALERKDSSVYSYLKATTDSVLAYLETHGCPKTEESAVLQAHRADKRARDEHDQQAVVVVMTGGQGVLGDVAGRVDTKEDADWDGNSTEGYGAPATKKTRANDSPVTSSTTSCTNTVLSQNHV